MCTNEFTHPKKTEDRIKRTDIQLTKKKVKKSSPHRILGMLQVGGRGGGDAHVTGERVGVALTVLRIH